MKKLIKWLGIALAIYAVFFIGMTIVKEQYAPTAGYIKAQNSEKLKDKKLNYALNEVNLEIPLVYINGRVPQEGKQTGVRLIMTLADMKPLTVPEQNYFNNNEVEKLVRIFIRGLDNYANATKNFQEWASSPRTRVIAKSNAGKEYGLEKYNDGITGSSRDDHYYYSPDKNIQTYIRCSNPDRPYPGCSMYFENGGFRYEVSFRRKGNIQNWKEIKSNSINLVNSFKKSPGE